MHLNRLVTRSCIYRSERVLSSPLLSPVFSLLRHRHAVRHHGHGHSHGRPPASPSPSGLDATQAESLRTSTTVLTIGLLSDLSMTGVKGVLGVLAGSGALISDAVHSLADVMVSVGSIVATRLASAPADSKHPYGHGKFDSLGSLAISAMLTATGLA